MGGVWNEVSLEKFGGNRIMQRLIGYSKCYFRLNPEGNRKLLEEF